MKQTKSFLSNCELLFFLPRYEYYCVSEIVLEKEVWRELTLYVTTG